VPSKEGDISYTSITFPFPNEVDKGYIKGGIYNFSKKNLENKNICSTFVEVDQ